MRAFAKLVKQAPWSARFGGFDGRQVCIRGIKCQQGKSLAQLLIDIAPAGKRLRWQMVAGPGLETVAAVRAADRRW